MGNVALTVDIPPESMAALKRKATESGISLDELVIQFSNTISADDDNDEADDGEENCPELDKYNIGYNLEDIKRWEAEADSGPIYENIDEMWEALEA